MPHVPLRNVHSLAVSMATNTPETLTVFLKQGERKHWYCPLVSRLSASLAITMPLPALAVTMKPALMTEMMARPSALAITWAAKKSH